MTDTIEKVYCPACGKLMHKIFIGKLGINVDICTDGCGGLYFDNNEIREFSDVNDDISEIKQQLANKTYLPVNQNKTRVCPSCNTPMAKTLTAGVQIDTCYQCGGIFLDNGEFEIVRTHFKKLPRKPQASIENILEALGENNNIYDEYPINISQERFTRQLLRGNFIGAIIELLF